MQSIVRLSPSINNDSSNNSRFVFILFCIVIIFQITALKYIWSLENVSRIVNLFALITLVPYAFIAVGTEYHPKKIWYYYLAPGIFIFCGMFLNISLGVISNSKLISIYGLTLPWVIYLIIPGIIKKKEIDTQILWKFYYYFMLCSNIFGILDYILMYYGVSNLRVLNTPFGVFLGGSFSLLYMLEDGAAHYRYYSCFMEPGTLAMFLLPAISYAFFHKKYFGLLVFLIAFFLTDSLGGIISLLILIIIILFLVLNQYKKYLLFGMSSLFVITLILWFNYGGILLDRYDNKNNSATVRENNLTNTIANLPLLLINNPLGIKLVESTESFEKNKAYIGSNFSPVNYLQYGGILSFVGYVICLVVSLSVSLMSILRNNLLLEQKVVFSSIIVLFPFIFQRTTVWESALFAFLFAPTIIKAIHLAK